MLSLNCSRCKRILPENMFWKKNVPYTKHRNYRRYLCKECSASIVSEWHLANPDRVACMTKKCYEKNKEKIIRDSMIWVKQNPHKCRAHTAVHRALKRGLLVKPTHCESCRKEKYLNAHHEDYSRKLDVSWLCMRCHKNLHKAELNGLQSINKHIGEV